MTVTRAFRRLICSGLIGLMLFSQLAIAAYACPALSAAAGPASQSMVAAQANDAGAAAVDAMAGCDQMAGGLDEAAPNLCAEHCHYGQQSNYFQAPSVPAVALVSLYLVAPTVLEAPSPMSATAASVDVPPAAPMPHAILHCVYRI